MVKVYKFTFLDEGHGRPEMLVAGRKSPIERIKNFPYSEIVPGAEEEVDEADIDEQGRYIPGYSLEKEAKTALELRALIDAFMRSEGHPIDGAPWPQVSAVDPALYGANWRIARRGAPDRLAAILTRAEDMLTQRYRLV
jgi:hypothetical protein